MNSSKFTSFDSSKFTAFSNIFRSKLTAFQEDYINSLTAFSTVFSSKSKDITSHNRIIEHDNFMTQ